MSIAPQWMLILRVASSMADPFTKSDLVVACWRAHPDAFGFAIDGQSYPHSARVFAKMNGAAGLIHRGYLEQLDAHSIRITPRGRALAAKERAA